MNNITNITLPRPKEWYYNNDYLTIDLELFGPYLCALFNNFLGEYYYFQKFTPTIKTDKERPIWEQGEDRKNLAIITPHLHDEKSPHNYNRVRVVHFSDFRPPYLPAFTATSKEWPSLFSKAPLKLDEKEFLLYFGDYACENVKIGLGYIEDGQFIPTDAFKRSAPTTEIEHINPAYPFVEDFIRAVFNYKIVNRKPNLNENDMEVILEDFGISRIEKLQTITSLLKNVQEASTEILLGNNNVGDVLKLERTNNSTN